MSIIDLLIGRPIATFDERAEQIGIAKGIPIFGLDALSSAAYGPEAALTLLIPLGVAGIAHIVPITAYIVVLLIIVFFSYRQTIAAYPGGGGSYTVAHENLGVFPGLLAGSALMIDYVLTAAVGISAGIGALTSALPSLHPRTPAVVPGLTRNHHAHQSTWHQGKRWCLSRPYLSVSHLHALGNCDRRGQNPRVRRPSFCRSFLRPLFPPPVLRVSGCWLKAFSSGCTAITGVEAVSNGVKAFREPTCQTAQRTLAIIIACLVAMLGGIAYLVHQYKIAATNPDSNHYQSVLSMLFAAVAGPGWFYYIAIGSVLLVLVFSANTAFADFPRVCRVIAEDRFLPVSLATPWQAAGLCGRHLGARDPHWPALDCLPRRD